jgi:multiple sugar transport system permease protein
MLIIPLLELTAMPRAIISSGIILIRTSLNVLMLMTMGGPQNATNTLVYSVYLNAFSYNRVGYAEAIAWVLMVLVGALTILNFFIKKYWAQPLE